MKISNVDDADVIYSCMQWHHSIMITTPLNTSKYTNQNNCNQFDFHNNDIMMIIIIIIILIMTNNDDDDDDNDNDDRN